MKRKLKDFGKLSVAEAALRDRLGTGGDDADGFVIINATRPHADADPDDCIRGDFIRYLMLGGCSALPHPVPETWVRVWGARITGVVNLEGASCPRDLALVHCHIDAPPILRSAHLGSLNLSSSKAPSLEASNVKIDNDINLHRTIFDGSIMLNNSHISGDLRFYETKINLDKNFLALNASGMKLIGRFVFWKDIEIAGIIDLTAAHIGHFYDRVECWPKTGLVLDRCRYGAFTGDDSSSAARIKWLHRTHLKECFYPQPWEHCAKVLQDMGHSADARAVLIDKEKHQRRDRRKRVWLPLRPLAWAIDALLNVTIRYGHQPLLAFFWLAVMGVLGWYVFNTTAQNHAIKPNTPIVLRSAEWVDCLDAKPSQLACYQSQPAAQSYPQFNAFIYSVDTLLPIVDLEMQGFWIPDDRVMPWARWYLWLHIAMGSALSLLAVAGFSGLIKGRS
ncbi:MAG: hypothetical protein ACWA40_05200 [Planktomarina sp.]